MVATTPIVTPTIVPVHEAELELAPAPDPCVAFKKLEVVFVAVGVISTVVFMTAEVGDVAVDAGCGVVSVVTVIVVPKVPIVVVAVVGTCVIEIVLAVD